MGRDGEAEIISLIKDLQKRMTYLERKIDTLVHQSSEKSLGMRSNPQGGRAYGGQQRYTDPRENRFEAKGERSNRPFKSKGNHKNKGAPKRRKPFNPAAR